MSAQQPPSQSAARTAPVQQTRAGRIPWDLHVRAWQVYAALGHGDQSAERIAERGGFGGGEIIRLLAERDPWSNSGWAPLAERHRARLARIRAEGLEAL